MIANIFFYLSTISLVLSLAKVMLSIEQKVWITDMTIRLWNFLDDFSKVSYLTILRSKRYQVGTLVTFAMLMHLTTNTYTSNHSVQLALTFDAFVPLVTIALFRFTVSRSGWKILFFSVASVLIVALLLIVLILGNLDELVPSCCTGFEPLAAGGIFILAFVTLIMFIILPVIVAQLIKLVIYACEFMVRKTAEYPEGVVAAVSAVMTALSGYIKGF